MASKPKKGNRLVIEGIVSQWDIDLIDVVSLSKRMMAVSIGSHRCIFKILFRETLKNKDGQRSE